MNDRYVNMIEDEINSDCLLCIVIIVVINIVVVDVIED